MKNNRFYCWLWPKLSFIKLKLSMLKTDNYTNLKEILANIREQEFPSDRAKINYVRNWVKSNSTHLIDDEHNQYAFNVPIVLSKLYAHSKGQGALPHLSCGPRAYAMKEILDGLKIKSRIIDLFGLSGDEPYKVSPHTLIEVYEADRKIWVLQDPDFNVAYSEKQTGQYLSVRKILKLGKGQLAFDSNNYEIENPINLKNTINELFEFCGLYRMSYEGRRSILLINSTLNRLDDKVLSEVGEYTLFSQYIYRRDYKYNVEYL